MSSSQLIRVAGLRKVFEADAVSTVAVNDVSLAIDAGEYVVLRGPSGCGKSTLLALLGLMEVPTAGEIQIEGVATARLPERELARIRGVTIGFVFQAFHLIPYLTVRDNIALPLRFHRTWSARERNEAVEDAVRRVGMEHRLDHFPEQLSGGQQQRIAIARALAGRPRLLLVDEPTGNLDSANGDQVMQLLADAHTAGAAVCLVTHDPRYQSVGQRTIEMLDGNIAAPGAN